MRLYYIILAISSAWGSLLPRADPPVKFTVLQQDRRVHERYIVSLKPGHTLAAHWKAVGQDLSRTGQGFMYMEAINVYMVTLDDADIVHTAVRFDTKVEAVETDHYIDLSQFEMPDSAIADVPNPDHQKRWGKATEEYAWYSQAADSAGKKREFPELDHEYEYYYPFHHMKDPLAGAGVDIYILDSGVRISHVQFGGRARNWKDLKPTDPSPWTNTNMSDNTGHGTHVAGTAGAGWLGMAPGANIISLKVAGDGGTDATVALAINTVTEAHIEKKRTPPQGWKGSVINMSLGTAPSVYLKRAVDEAVAQGIPIAAAAGNSNEYASRAPCRFNNVICVASVDSHYRKAPRSNWGGNVDVIAPGVDIKSLGSTDDHAYRITGGTSMASPQVAGVMATFLSYEGKELYTNAYKVYKRLERNMLKDITTGFPYRFVFWPTTVNLFLQNGINHPDRDPLDPYAGIPRDELRGTCKLDVQQIWTCGDSDARFFANMQIRDTTGGEMYSTSALTTTTVGMPMKDGEPVKLYEPGMDYMLSMTWNHADDHIQFIYGHETRFAASGSGAGEANVDGRCTLKSSNWNANGPQGCPGSKSVSRRFECEYKCEEALNVVLSPRRTEAGQAVKNGVKLRILPAGDSITVGAGSSANGGDGDGYRRQLKKNLSKNEVVFAGTERFGTMDDGYCAAWNSRTIQYISDHIGPSLKQRPNIILLAAGTNDLNENVLDDPSAQGAVERLGKAVDKMLAACPDATILVAMIIPTCVSQRIDRFKEYHALIPGMVRSRRHAGKHVLAADFSSFKTSDLYDCIHPTNPGYKIMGDWWYSFINQIPESWIKSPVGPDPNRSVTDEVDASRNGGIDKNIADPSWGTSPVKPSSKAAIKQAVTTVKGGFNTAFACKTNPIWQAAGQIALGNVGSTGAWRYETHWQEKGVDAQGIGRDGKNVRLADMNGDGNADYVWLNATTGEIRVWLNNRPDGRWQHAGTDDDLIGKGVGPAKTIYLADLNGDGMADYLVVNQDTGAVRIWWNYGPNKDWQHGWKWVEGIENAGGVPHANLATLRFPDVNGDGRADYTYIGEGGSVRTWLNVGAPGGTSLVWQDIGGIATGAVGDISRLVFADMNGDGRDDYLIWDSDAGLSGFLNRQTNREGVPFWEDQGKAKAFVGGIHKPHSEIRLADMDGDGKDDYVHVDEKGAISIWYNRGITEDHMQIDNIRFADIDGDGIDDYIYLDPKSGAPTIYLNKGPNNGDSLGWLWKPVNGGRPVAGGAAPAKNVVFGDINGDGRDDYIVLHPETGQIKVWLNGGEAAGTTWGWGWVELGSIASGVGPGGRVRIADIDGDGRDDYIYLNDKGGMIVYRNIWSQTNTGAKYEHLEAAEAEGITQSPDEIQLIDINGDGKADYVWTRKFDGRTRVWFNNYPNSPRWREDGEIAGGVGTAGSNIRWGKLTSTGRADYIAIDPYNGAIAPWLNGCSSPIKPGSPDDPLLKEPDFSKNELHCTPSGLESSYTDIIRAGELFCSDVKADAGGEGKVLTEYSLKKNKNSKDAPTLYHFEVSLKIDQGCKWKYTDSECKKYFKVLADDCRPELLSYKRGGWVENNCLLARIDVEPGT